MSSTTEREALSEKPEEDAVEPLAYLDSREANFLSELPKYMMLLGMLAASITYLVEKSPTCRESKLRDLLLGCLIVAFLCFEIMRSLMLRMRRTVTCRGHGFCSWALRVTCRGHDFCSCALGVYMASVALIELRTSIWSSGSLTTSSCISAFFMVAVLLCQGLHQVVAFLRKPPEKLGPQ